MPAAIVVSVPTVFESDGPFPVTSAIEILRERATDVVRDLLSRAPAGSIRAAFAAGGVGRGEAWSETRDGVLAIFSDVDVYVVADDAHVDAVRRAATEAAARPHPSISGVVLHRGIEIGVYTMSDLLAQPARPGTIDLAEHHVWLHGDRSIVDALGRALNRRIDPVEALYLLENRAWDALVAAVSVPSGVTRATAAKVVLDILSAHLIAEGRFRPTHDERWLAYGEHQPERVTRSLTSAIPTADRVRRGASAASIEPREALALVAEAWLALAPSILLGAGTGARTPQALIAVRCNRGRVWANYREFVRMRTRMQMGLVRAAAVVGWRFAGLSPRATLRTHALVRALTESKLATPHALFFHTEYVARLASSIGYVDGSVDERARAVFKAVS